MGKKIIIFLLVKYLVYYIDIDLTNIFSIDQNVIGVYYDKNIKLF